MHFPRQNPNPNLAQLERILASETFRSAERMSRFLRYVVEQTLAGNTDHLKESVIGVEVYGKPATYDPRVDSTVRSEAGKLRARLAQYYESEGRLDPVIVSIPKGGYSAEFRGNVVVQLPQRAAPVEVLSSGIKHRLGARSAMAAGVILLMAGGAYWMRKPAPRMPGELTRLTWDLGVAAAPSLSSEAKLVAYASDRAGKGSLNIWMQPVPGGAAIQLTKGDGDETDPELSPDGALLAYVASGDGGGIYVMPALGGPARLLVKGGRRPKFSPDGASIAYYVGDPQLFQFAVASGKMFVIRLDSGATKPVAGDFRVAVNPIWTPDGGGLLFQGYRGEDFATVKLDWWVAPVDGRPAVKTGVREALMRQKVCADWAVWRPAGWWKDSVVFHAGCGAPSSLWRIPLDRRTWQPSGPALQLTMASTGAATDPTVARSGEIAFAGAEANADVWALPLDTDAGRVTGPVAPLTRTAAAEEHPSVSRDGRTLVYASRRSGNPDIWLMDTATGQERAVAIGPVAQNYPEISPEGDSLTYHEVIPDDTNPVGYRHVAWRQPVAGGESRKLCDDCSYMGPGPGGGFFDHGHQPIAFVLVDPASQARRRWLSHPRYDLMAPSPNPAGKWMAFTAKTGGEVREVFVAPYSGAEGPAEQQWVSFGPGMMPVWSPNGRLLYFASARDGSLCLWGQQVDSGRPRGAAFPVLHFHGSRLRLRPGAAVFRWMSAARDRIVFPAAETTSNLWLLR